MPFKHPAVLLNLDKDLRPPSSCSLSAHATTLSWARFLNARVEHMQAYYTAQDDIETHLALNELAETEHFATIVQQSSPRPQHEPLVRCCYGSAPVAPRDCQLCPWSSSSVRLAEHLALDHELQRCSTCCLDCLHEHCASHDTKHLWEHMASHGTQHCDECGFDILTRLFLSSHRVRHHAWVECPVCGDDLPTTDALAQHQQTHPLCKVCERPQRPESYLHHLVTEHNYTRCPLPRCAMEFAVDEFKMHMAACHSEAQTATRISSAARKPNPPLGMLRSIYHDLKSAKAAGRERDPDQLLSEIQKCIDSFESTGPESPMQPTASQTPTTAGDTTEDAVLPGEDEPETAAPQAVDVQPAPSSRSTTEDGGARDYQSRLDRPETGTAPVTQSDVQQRSADSNPWSINAEGLGSHLIDNIAGFIADPKFTLPISVTANVDWKEVVDKIRPPRGHDMLAVRYDTHPERGVSHLFLAAKEFRRPNLDIAVEELPQDVEAWWDKLIEDPPKGVISYYVGPLPRSRLDSLFPSGIPGLPLIPGATTLYGHWGDPLSGTPFHKEDPGLRSYNVPFVGGKLFLLIDLQSTAAFEALMDRLHPDPGRGRCDGFVRHKSLLITTKTLRNSGIKFEMVLAGPGDMVVTEPNQYHAVVNVTTSFAISTNFVLPGELPIPPGSVVCKECGFFELDHRNLVKLSDNKPETAGAGPHLSNTGKKRKANPTPTVANKRHKPTPAKVMRLVDWVTSKEAILQFRNLVQGSREFDVPLRQRFRLPEKLHAKAKALHDLNRSVEGKEVTSQLYHIITDIELVRVVDTLTGKLTVDEAGRETQGRCRADPSAWTKVCKVFGLPDNRNSQAKVKRAMEIPRKWHKIFADREGLQCFLPFGKSDLSLSDFSQLLDEEISSFHEKLGEQPHVKELCNIGNDFVRCVWKGLDVPEFLWETRTYEELRQLDLESLMRLQAPFQVIEDNVPQIPDWPKPVGWPWDWPAEPDCVQDEARCELCHDSADSACTCITSRFKSDFTVAACGKKGRGLLAGVPGRGTVVFRKGEPLGRLVGELVAPGTYANGWAFDLVRRDLPKSPKVAQIYCRDKGNVFRLVNHACGNSASAMVQCIRVGGVFAPVFFACQDLKDGDEITADCGPGFLKGDGVLEDKVCCCVGCQPSAPV